MTYEEYKKQGLCTTKEEYLQMQKNNLAGEIKGEKSIRNLSIFASLVSASVVILSTVYLFGEQFQDFSSLEKVVCSLPIPIIAAPFILRGVTAQRTVKVLKSKKVELPTIEELENYNRGQYHSTEAIRYKSKIR